MIPGVPECFELIEQQRMLENIRDHSVVVANVAAFLADGINRGGANLSLPLTIAAALLHDIGKTACLDSDRDHARHGREICLEHGYDEVADIVGDHVRLRNSRLPEITENEVVFYADKRVNHDVIVSLGERKRYILERYGLNIPERIEVITNHCLKWNEVEAQIFSRFDFQPDQLADNLGADCLSQDVVRNMRCNLAEVGRISVS